MNVNIFRFGEVDADRFITVLVPSRSSMAKDINQELRTAIDAAAARTDLDPTPEQKQSGKYDKGRFDWHGLTIVIENPRRTTRSGTDASGVPWSVTMPDHYGYVSQSQLGATISEADGDHIDVFMGPSPESQMVYIVDQLKPDGSFDEAKCILPGQELRGDILAASKAFYSGVAVKIHCAAGTLSVTPNHPVLTLRGLIPAGDLNKGDYLLADLREGEPTIPCNDEQHTPAQVEQVFGTLTKTCPTAVSVLKREFITPFDFHGDACCLKGDVDIVRSYGELGGNFVSDAAECLNKGCLVGHLVAEADLPSCGTFHKGLGAKFVPFIPLADLRTFQSSALPIFWRQSRYGKPQRFGIPTDANLSLLKAASDNCTINSQTIGNLLDRFAVGVTPNKIVDIEMVHYEGPVYDFQSTSGLIVVNRLVISNCMLGFNSQQEAEEGYQAAYSPGWEGLGGITAMTIPQFIGWLNGGQTDRPLSPSLNKDLQGMSEATGADGGYAARPDIPDIERE